MKRCNGLTLERHQALGPELKAVRDQLLTLAVEIGNAYPKQSRQARAAEKAYQALDGLRCAMDDAVCHENQGDTALDLCRIYYPGQAVRA